MDLQTFENSLNNNAPPPGISSALQALWQDANDDWDEAHRLTQKDDDRAGAWVHAYLHRKEGDASNAAPRGGGTRMPSPHPASAVLQSRSESLLGYRLPVGFSSQGGLRPFLLGNC